MLNYDTPSLDGIIQSTFDKTILAQFSSLYFMNFKQIIDSYKMMF